MCEKKEGPLDLTHWVQMMCGQTQLPLDQFMRHLESVMTCLPRGTWSLVIHVDGPDRAIRAAVDPEAERRFPAIWEYLTCCLVNDKGREPATLIVCCEEGQVKLCLSDRETNQVLWRSSETVIEALDALEKALVGGAKDWRERKEYKRK